MSHYGTRPIPPRPATQQEVNQEIARLRRQLEAKLKAASAAASKEATDRAKKLMEAEVRRIEKSIEALDKATRKSLEKMDKAQRERLQEVTRRIYDDMARAQKEMNDRLDREIRDVHKQMDTIVEGINDLAHDIDRRFMEEEQVIAGIQDDLADIHQRFQDEDQLAVETVKAAQALLDLVEQRTMLDRFAPGYEASDVRDRVSELAGSHLHGSALTARAEEAITQIWQTERHAMQEKAKHDAMVEIALTQVGQVLTVVNDNRELEQAVEGGDPIRIENEFWSEGEFGRLEQELKGLQDELNDRYNRNLTRERIEIIIKRSAEIEKRILEISAESVAKAILSEARVETIEDVVNALEKKGWIIKVADGKPECDYMGGMIDHDWRKGVCAILENNLGEEITIIVDPVSEGLNQLIVHQETSPDGDIDRKVQEKMDIIKDELCDLGYEVGAPTTGVADIPEMGSAKRLGKAHASDKVHQKIDKR